MTTCKINVTRIDKSALFPGKNGKYLDLVLWENKDGPDKFGNDGFITQDLGKERRARGEKGPIIGNWRRIGKKLQQQAPATAQDAPPVDEDDVPF